MKIIFTILCLFTSLAQAADFIIQVNPKGSSVGVLELKPEVQPLSCPDSRTIIKWTGASWACVTKDTVGDSDIADGSISTSKISNFISEVVSAMSSSTSSLQSSMQIYYAICRKISDPNSFLRMPILMGPSGLSTAFTKLPSGYYIGEPKANGVMMFYNSASGTATTNRTNPIYRFELSNCGGTPYLAFPAIAYDLNNSLFRVPAMVTKSGNRYFKVPKSEIVFTQKSFASFLDSSGNCANSSATVSYSFLAEEIAPSDPALSDVDVTKCSYDTP